jgi:hypothetical protein
MVNWHQIAFVFAVLIGGCSGGPDRVKPPKIDPSSATTQAMELYDADHDGKLNENELAKCQGVQKTLAGYDANHDKSIDAEEFQSHLTNLLSGKVGASQLSCTIIYAGQPLAGATVVFEPEPYLGDEIQPADGVTSNAGIAEIGMPPEKTPPALKRFKLIQYGTYKVRVTHPTIAIPAKYNKETTLGYESIPGQPGVTFTLTAK